MRLQRKGGDQRRLRGSIQYTALNQAVKARRGGLTKGEKGKKRHHIIQEEGRDPTTARWVATRLQALRGPRGIKKERWNGNMERVFQGFRNCSLWGFHLWKQEEREGKNASLSLK